jgi:hypothetical protein
MESKLLSRSKEQKDSLLQPSQDVCSICGEPIQNETRELHSLAENWLIEQIKKDHPDWVESDGLCPKCIEYYLDL